MEIPPFFSLEASHRQPERPHGARKHKNLCENAKTDITTHRMPEDHDSDKVWDEYDWERFLQQQDIKTERYMELLEKYIDDPNRDQIIAKEMGWSHLLDTEEPDWGDFFADEEEEDDDESLAEGEGEQNSESFEFHPLYQASFALTLWVDQLFEELGEAQHHPAAIRLATHSAVASSKLAAALSDDDVDELGMTIAYLKRALKAITIAMEASLQFGRSVRLPLEKRNQLRRRLFHVRDGIIQLMGEYRDEWRRRFEK